MLDWGTIYYRQKTILNKKKSISDVALQRLSGAEKKVLDDPGRQEPDIEVASEIVPDRTGASEEIESGAAAGDHTTVIAEPVCKLLADSRMFFN